MLVVNQIFVYLKYLINEFVEDSIILFLQGILLCRTFVLFQLSLLVDLVNAFVNDLSFHVVVGSLSQEVMDT